jgi:pilus assembly protein CpaB
MRLVSILIIAGALVLGGLVLVIGLRFARAPQQAQAPPPAQIIQNPTQHVLVAAHALPAGTVLKLEDVRFQSWPQDGVDPSYLVQEKGADPKKVAVGKIVLHGIDPGQPITQARLLKPGESGFLAAAITPGMRAVTVPINATSGEAGFILPGDHVDVVLQEHYAINVSAQVTEASKNLPAIATRDVATVILRDVKILAIAQNIQDIDGKPNPGAATATLEVDLPQAQKIEVASTLGTLSLLLRSHTLPARPEPEGASPSVEDFQASPYRAAVLQQIYSNIAQDEDEAGATHIYHGTQLARARPGQ